jgi:hypothetical protein
VEIYADIFARFDREASAEARDSLEFHLNFFKSIHEKLKLGVLDAERTSKSFLVFSQLYRSLISSIQHSEAEDLRHFEGQLEPSFKSSVKGEIAEQFSLFAQWFKAELQETAAMIDAIESVYHLESLKLKAVSKLSAEKSSLLKIQLGKSPLFQSKSKEKRTSTTEEHIRSFEKEITELQRLINITQVRLSEFEFPRYKHHRARKYEALLQTFGKVHYLEIESLAAVLREVSQAK